MYLNSLYLYFADEKEHVGDFVYERAILDINS